MWIASILSWLLSIYWHANHITYRIIGLYTHKDSAVMTDYRTNQFSRVRVLPWQKQCQKRYWICLYGYSSRQKLHIKIQTITYFWFIFCVCFFFFFNALIHVQIFSHSPAVREIAGYKALIAFISWQNSFLSWLFRWNPNMPFVVYFFLPNQF